MQVAAARATAAGMACTAGPARLTVDVLAMVGDAVPPVTVAAAVGLGVAVGGMVGVAVGQNVTVGVVPGVGMGGGGGVVGTAVATVGGRGVGRSVGRAVGLAVLVPAVVAELVALATAATTGSGERGQVMTATTLRATASSNSAARIAISRLREPPTTNRSIRAYQACSRARTVSFQSLASRRCGPVLCVQRAPGDPVTVSRPDCGEAAPMSAGRNGITDAAFRAR